MTTPRPDPPPVLIACALLWIGLMVGVHLSAFAVTIASTCLAVVVVPAYVVWLRRRWSR